MHQHGSSNQPQPNRQQTRLSLPIKLVLYATIGIIAYFLITEHRAHLAGFLPYSFLFIFMFMCLFMPGGHGGHGGHRGGNGGNQRITGREDELDQGHGGHGGGNDSNSQSPAKNPRSDATNQSNSRRSNHEGHE